MIISMVDFTSGGGGPTGVVSGGVHGPPHHGGLHLGAERAPPEGPPRRLPLHLPRPGHLAGRIIILCPAGLHSVPSEFMRIFIFPLGCRDQYKILVPREQYLFYIGPAYIGTQSVYGKNSRISCTFLIDFFFKQNTMGFNQNKMGLKQNSMGFKHGT